MRQEIFLNQDLNTGQNRSRSGLNIVFIGSLIRRKGVDLLLDAVQRLVATGQAVTLDIYGPGDSSKLANRTDAIRYCGTVPFGAAQSVISGYDLLILPSRYDGWGVVVNEALCAGVPVVCSTMVGAATLLDSFDAGATFNSGDTEDLCRVLSGLIDNEAGLMKLQVGASNARQLIQPEIAARYLHEVVMALRQKKTVVASPWYRAWN